MTILDSRPEAALDSQPEAHFCGPVSADLELTGQTPDTWPPPGSEVVDVEDLYARLADRGMTYGPSFRLLRAAWRRGDEVFAEVAIDDAQVSAERMTVHPALLDAALHAASIPFLERGGDHAWLPFAWQGVRVHATGVSAMRIRIGSDGDDSSTVSLSAADHAPVLCARSLMVRPISREQLRGSTATGSLLRPVWAPVAEVPSRSVTGETWALLGTDHLGAAEAAAAAGHPLEHYASLHALDAALRRGATAPSVVLVCSGRGSGAQTGAAAAVDVRAEALRGLIMVQEWLSDERLESTRLVFVTEGAQVASQGDGPVSLAAAAVWGLVRSSQAEQPGRFGLLDMDVVAGAGRALVTAVTALTDPDAPLPQLAVRDKVLLQLRAQRVRADEAPASAPHRIDPDSTVVMTGGTGALGRVLARHLVKAHGVRHLRLLSRSGPSARGAAELVAELAELGAATQVSACDVADPVALARVLADIDIDHPVRTIVHAAGVTDDGAVGTLTPRRVDRVFRAKVDAALALHEASLGLPGCDLILFSSVSGQVGGAGQANYAAANTFVDALASYRQAAGQRAISLAWGLWDEAGMGEKLAAADLARMERAAISALRVSDGLALFDAALGRPEAVLIPIQLHDPALRAHSPQIPDLLRDLCPPRSPDQTSPSQRDVAADPALLRRTLAELAEDERKVALEQLIRMEVAQVLALPGADDVDPSAEFSSIGFDSLTTVDLNRRLAAMTGLRLPATLLFDHRTPAVLTGHLCRLFDQAG
jgi:NADP-dependent 3-hydroxy acid dehydrogenase YdfG/acyl carrier protein